jgi:hypothetical protein
MTSSPDSEPEPLYEAPGGIASIQVLGYFQVVGMLMLGAVLVVLGFIGPAIRPVVDFVSDPHAPRIYEDSDPLADAQAVFLLTGEAAFIIAILMAIMIWGIDQGERWARTGMIALQAIIVLATVIGTVLTRSSYLGCFGIMFAAAAVPVVAGLMTSSVSQWIKQGGWDPWYQRYYAKKGRKRR